MTKFEDLSPEEKKIVSEEQYRKQKFQSSYSVKGKDYKPKYDTGEVIGNAD